MAKTWQNLISGLIRKGPVLMAGMGQAYSEAWKPQVPYSVLMVQFAEGPRMFLDLDDPEKRYVETDLVGETIAVGFEKVSDTVGIPRAVYPAGRG